ncbi:MAG: phosphoribosyl-AMP cyclohydrolase [Planctomycetota bacterium]
MSKSAPSSIPDFERGVRYPGCNDPLLPAIAQDADSGEVLMVAWMNRDAFEATLKSKRATYYSRSRGQIWVKGETSGHVQQVREMRTDCDADAIVLKVKQTGAACHQGYPSCFFRTFNDDGSTSVNAERLVDPQTVYGSSDT